MLTQHPAVRRLGGALLIALLLFPRLCTADLRERVSVDLKDRPLHELLETLSARRHVEILADNAVLDRPVAIVGDATPAWRILQAAVEQGGILWFVDDAALLICNRQSSPFGATGASALAPADLAAQNIVAFITSLDNEQRSLLLSGDVLAWKTLSPAQAELLPGALKHLRPEGLPWSIGERNRGLQEGVAFCFDPYVTYQMPNQEPVRVFFRAHKSLTSLLAVKPREDQRGFEPVGAGSDAEPSRPTDENGEDTKDLATDRIMPQRSATWAEYTLSEIIEGLPPDHAPVVALPPAGERGVTVYGSLRPMPAELLLKRAVNCLGLGCDAFGEASALYARRFELRPGWQEQLEFPPTVGTARIALQEAFRPFALRRDLAPTGCPLLSETFLPGGRMDAGSLQGDAERFFIDQLPKPDVETPAKPKPAGLGQYEIQTGSSFLMVVLAYGPDNFGCHPLRVHWVCTTQVLCGYGETLIPVAEVREEP